MNRRMVVLAAMMVLGSIALAEDKGSSFFGWRGAWGFALRPGDPDRKLRFARSPE